MGRQSGGLLLQELRDANCRAQLVERGLLTVHLDPFHAGLPDRGLRTARRYTLAPSQWLEHSTNGRVICG